MSGIQTGGDLFRVLFNAVPLPLFRVTADIEVLDYNLAAGKLMDAAPGETLGRRSGDLLHCVNASGCNGGCGATKACADCLIRNSVTEVLKNGDEICRRRTGFRIYEEGAEVELELLLTVTPIDFAGENSVLLCLEDITELTSLREILPICANCKKIRDDQQLWNSVEHYFSRFMGVDFTHSICPECARLLYPEIYRNKK